MDILTVLTKNRLQLTNDIPENIVKSIIALVTTLKDDEQFFIPGGWTGHSILYEFAKKGPDTLVFNIYNTGKGAEYHAVVIDFIADRFHAVKSFEFNPYVDLNCFALFIKELIDLQQFSSSLSGKVTGSKKLYEIILQKMSFLAGKEILPETNEDLIIKGQMSGTCSQAVIECLINSCFIESDERKQFLFQYKLHSLKEYSDLIQTFEEDEQTEGRYHQIILAAEQLLLTASQDSYYFTFKDSIKIILLASQERYQEIKDKKLTPFLLNEKKLQLPKVLKNPEPISYQTAAASKDSDCYILNQLAEKKAFFLTLSLENQEGFYITEIEYIEKLQALTSKFEDYISLQTSLYGEKSIPNSETIVVALYYLHALGELAKYDNKLSFQKLISCYIQEYLANNAHNPFIINEDSVVMQYFDRICKKYACAEVYSTEKILAGYFDEAGTLVKPQIWREFLLENKHCADKIGFYGYSIRRKFDEGVLVKHALIKILNHDEKDQLLTALHHFIAEKHPQDLLSHKQFLDQIELLCTFNRLAIKSLSLITASLSTVKTPSSLEIHFDSNTIWSAQRHFGLFECTRNTFDAAVPESLRNGFNLSNENIFVRLERLCQSDRPKGINAIICLLNVKHPDYLLHKTLLEACNSGTYKVANVLNFFTNNPEIISKPEGLFALRHAFFSHGSLEDFTTHLPAYANYLADFFQKTITFHQKTNPELGLKLYNMYLHVCLFCQSSPLVEYPHHRIVPNLTYDSEHYKQELLLLINHLSNYELLTVNMISKFYEVITSIEPNLIQFDSINERIFFTTAKAKIQQAIQSDSFVYEHYLQERFANQLVDTSLFPLVRINNQVFDIYTGMIQQEPELIEITLPPLLKSNSLFTSLFPTVERVFRHPYLEYYEFSHESETYRVSMNRTHQGMLDIERNTPILGTHPVQYKTWRYIPREQIDGKYFIQTVINKKHEFWLDTETKDWLITNSSNHSLYYIDHKSGLITLAGTQGMLLLQSPIFAATAAFEGNAFTETQILANGSLHILLPRYGLELNSNLGNLQKITLHLEKQFYLCAPEHFIPGFWQWLHCAAIDNPAIKYALIPFKPFVIDELSPSKSEYYCYRLDTDGKLDDGDTSCSYLRIAVDEQGLKPVTLNEVLYLLYLCMGTRQFTQALIYLKLIQTKFLHQDLDEQTCTILDWIIFSLPNIKNAPQKCAINTPEVIALKLHLYERFHGFDKDYVSKVDAKLNKDFLKKQWPQKTIILYKEYIHCELSFSMLKGPSISS